METLAAVIASGTVQNVIVYDAAATWSPPEGTTLVVLDPGVTAGIGYTYAGGVFTAPPPPPPPPPDPGLTSDKSQITANNTDVATVHYQRDPNLAPVASVIFTVNGATSTVTVTNNGADLAITTAVAGPVEVSVDALVGTLLTITAV